MKTYSSFARRVLRFAAHGALFGLPLGAAFGLSGCGVPTAAPIAAAPTAMPTSIPVAAPKTRPAPAPTMRVKIVQSGRSSLPTLPQMMGNEPRPTFIPLPTPIRTIIISNARPTSAPRENPTIIISNAPVAGTAITPQAAAAQGLVWANTRTMIYHRPGTRSFGGTQDGYYISEAQAQARGFRAALR